MSTDADVIVVGGGLAGTAAAISLARAGLETVHLAPKAPPDRRTSALMTPSVEFLQRTGLIEDPDALGHPLAGIRIIDATGRLMQAPETLFRAEEAGHRAFGWNFGNADLLDQFRRASSDARLTVLESAVAGYRRVEGTGVITTSDGRVLQAPLVVGADGKASLVRGSAGIATRQTRFDEAALVCDLELGRSLGDTSVEFHYPRGPFTLVPAGGKRANLVWIDDEDRLRDAQAAGPEALSRIFRDKAQRLFGPMALLSPSVVFPLGTVSVARAGRDGTVLVGESAHAFPPIGAQGLNLGLRDVEDLIVSIGEIDRQLDTWAGAVSERYADKRAGDLARTGGMVDALFRSLLMEALPGQVARAGGLWAMRVLPGLRRQAFALGMGQRSA